MSEKKLFTPGPWEAYRTTGAGWSVRRHYGRPGYTGLTPVCSMAWWWSYIPGIIDAHISEANARLIAAAPTMLETIIGISGGLEMLREAIRCERLADADSLCAALKSKADAVLVELEC